MRPSCDDILKILGNALVTEYMPKIPADKPRTDLALMALMIGVVGEEIERAAARRLEENQELRDLFAKVLPIVRDPDLKRRLEQAARTREEDFRVSALDRLNAELLTLLIELHGHVETLEGEEARKAEQGIWQVLEGWTARRTFTTNELFEGMLLVAALQRLETPASTGIASGGVCEGKGA
jgi:hypothetical protein